MGDEEETYTGFAVSHKVAHLHSSSTSTLSGKTRDGESHELSGEIGQAKYIVLLGQWKVLRRERTDEYGYMNQTSNVDPQGHHGRLTRRFVLG